MSAPRIENELSKIKDWYEQHYPLCIFCGHLVKSGDLAHLIRRSYSERYILCKLNTGLAHRDCHEIFDNDIQQSVFLPRIIECLYIIWLLDERYFSLIVDNFTSLLHILQLFPNLPFSQIDHHGQIITLQYLKP